MRSNQDSSGDLLNVKIHFNWAAARITQYSACLTTHHAAKTYNKEIQPENWTSSTVHLSSGQLLELQWLS